MARVPQKNTTPELVLRRALHKQGLRYRLNDRSLPGTPDIVLPSRKLVIFVHGCFWHQHSCHRGTQPRTRADYWRAKFKRNAERHEAASQALDQLGWAVLVVWECETKDKAHLEQLVAQVRSMPTISK
ncbi:very short patch repair endonuclease [Methylocystis sp. JAN1]|uniref:very short patch repair endonuclease n=1 Tax=Methylocystis sp. JAN1 TaxID=3397211 RepID=UPI003FA1B748